MSIPLWDCICKLCNKEFQAPFKTTDICLPCVKILNNTPKFKYVFENGKLELKVMKK